jgi:hypothetical protein
VIDWEDFDMKATAKSAYKPAFARPLPTIVVNFLVCDRIICEDLAIAICFTSEDENCLKISQTKRASPH